MNREEITNWSFDKKMEEAENSGNNNILEILSRDSNKDVRKSIAYNKCTPEVILEILSKDTCEDVRAAVGLNSTSTEVLKRLSKDISEFVRRSVASNWDAPKSVLAILSKDTSDSVKKEILDNFNAPEGDYIPSPKLKYAENSDTSEEALEILSTDEDYEVRQAVAGNSNTTEEVLEILSTDMYEDVRKAVARNVNTSEGILEILSTDMYAGVREAVARNVNTSESIIKRLSEDSDKYLKEIAVVKSKTFESVLGISSDKVNETEEESLKKKLKKNISSFVSEMKLSDNDDYDIQLAVSSSSYAILRICNSKYNLSIHIFIKNDEKKIAFHFRLFDSEWKKPLIIETETTKEKIFLIRFLNLKKTIGDSTWHQNTKNKEVVYIKRINMNTSELTITEFSEGISDLEYVFDIFEEIDEIFNDNQLYISPF